VRAELATVVAAAAMAAEQAATALIVAREEVAAATDAITAEREESAAKMHLVLDDASEREKLLSKYRYAYVEAEKDCVETYARVACKLDSLLQDVASLRAPARKKTKGAENVVPTCDDIETSCFDLSHLCLVLSQCHKQANPAEIDTQEAEDGLLADDADSQMTQ
jgi:hypothetical protein